MPCSFNIQYNGKAPAKAVNKPEEMNEGRLATAYSNEPRYGY